jgi:hypothetical protein
MQQVGLGKVEKISLINSSVCQDISEDVLMVK